MVVERWWEPRLAKLGRKAQIEDKNRIYFVAHDTKWDPPKYLDVILMENVESEVKDGMCCVGEICFRSTVRCSTRLWICV